MEIAAGKFAIPTGNFGGQAQHPPISAPTTTTTPTKTPRQFIIVIVIIIEP